MQPSSILLLTTGGTIGSVPGPDGPIGHLSPDELLPHWGGAPEAYTVTWKEIFQQDSVNVQPAQWQQLAREIFSHYAAYDGIVVTHGTDTLAYTSSMLSFMLQNPPIPVVITGAQIPLVSPLSDGVSNLRCALAMAASGTPGVFVAFHGTILRGARAVKTHSLSLDAFHCAGDPQTAHISAHGLVIPREPLPASGGKPALRDALCEKVALLKWSPSFSPDILLLLAREGWEGIVIEGYGKGGLPLAREGWPDILARLRERDIPVVLCGQCQAESDYGESAAQCPAGCISGKDMTTEAAVTKLMWCLAQPRDPGQSKTAAAEAWFRQDLAGEKSTRGKSLCS